MDPAEIFQLAFPPSDDRPSQKTLRLREGFGAKTPETPPSLSWLEKEIERIVKRAMAEGRDS